MKALRQQKLEKNRITLMVDKGVAMFILDLQKYQCKAKILLEQPNTYRPIPSDPTNKNKAKVMNILRNIKAETGMDDSIYRRMYPSGMSSKFYRLPKVHNNNTSLRPIVSNRDSGIYGVAKKLARILKPFVGNYIHHVNNTQEFVAHIRNMKLGIGECITSYDVTALLTSVPVEPDTEIIKHKLEKDTELQQRTKMSVHHII